MKTVLIHLPDHFSIRNFLYSPFLEQVARSTTTRFIFVLNNPTAHSKRVSHFTNVALVDAATGESRLAEKVKRRFVKWLYETIHYRFSKINNLAHLRLKEAIPREYVVSYYDRFRASVRLPAPRSTLLFSVLYKLYTIPLGIGRRAQQLIAQHQPALVISTDPQTPPARSYLIAAHQRGIPTAVYINSWDYLTTDGPVVDSIDTFIGWNQRMGEELRRLHHSTKPFSNIGPLHMDTSLDADLWNKHTLAAALNINPEKKLVTYGVCGKRIGKHEPEVAQYIAQHLPPDAHLVIRGHPEDQSIPKRFQDVLSLPNVSLCMGELFDHMQTQNDSTILYSLLRHSSVVLCGPTTLTLDAIRFDTPVINIGFDGSRNVPPAASIAERFTIDHFAPLLTYNGIYYVKSFDELSNALECALAHPHELASGRARIRADYLEPLDGQASQRLYSLINRLTHDHPNQ